MFQRRIPDLLRHAPVPGVKSFAVLAAVESAARAIMISVFPIAMYNTFQDPEKISEIYLLIGIFSLIASLFVPWISRFIPRRKLYTMGVFSLIIGTICTLIGGLILLPLGLSIIALAVVTITICFNAYVMDFVARARLDEAETRRLQYSGAAWALGPFLGIWLYQWWQPAPFIVSLLASISLLVVFWIYRLGDGKTIAKAKTKTANPLAFLPSFFKQPRLIVGWAFAVIRSCGWWVYVVYLPIYAVESGLSEKVGGLFLSLSNALLFLVPFMLRWLNGRVRYGVTIGFVFSGIFFHYCSDICKLSSELHLMDVVYRFCIFNFVGHVWWPPLPNGGQAFRAYRNVSCLLKPIEMYLMCLGQALHGLRSCSYLFLPCLRYLE